MVLEISQPYWPKRFPQALIPASGHTDRCPSLTARPSAFLFVCFVFSWEWTGGKEEYGWQLLWTEAEPEYTLALTRHLLLWSLSCWVKTSSERCPHPHPTTPGFTEFCSLKNKVGRYSRIYATAICVWEPLLIVRCGSLTRFYLCLVFYKLWQTSS